MDGQVFICYSRKDEDFVVKLRNNLKSREVPVWYDGDIPPGENFDKAVEKALKECTHILVILSQSSVDSDWVRGEWLSALDEKKIVVPILYTPCAMPIRLKPIQYIDFTSRSPDDEEAIEQILNALGMARSTPQKPAAQPAKETPEPVQGISNLPEDHLISPSAESSDSTKIKAFLTIISLAFSFILIYLYYKFAFAFSYTGMFQFFSLILYGNGFKPLYPIMWSLLIITLFAVFWGATGLESNEYGGTFHLLSSALTYSLVVFLSGTKLFVDPPELPRPYDISRNLITQVYVLERTLGAFFLILFLISLFRVITTSQLAP
jgi:hypothetical protein